MKFLYILVFALMTGLTGCNEEAARDARYRQQIEAERQQRVKAEQRAKEQEKRKERWQNGAMALAAGSVVLLILGSALGSKARKDAHGRPGPE